MVILSSDAAQEHGILFDPDAAHCTRIDIQATAELLYADPTFIPKTYAHCLELKKRPGHPTKYGHIENSDGAHTLMVGSRQSLQYGRVYDKGLEQGGKVAGKQIRWELECKAEYAEQVCALCYQASDQEGQIKYLLKSFFEARGVPCFFNAREGEGHLVAAARRPDDLKTLAWLRGPVAGTVERLMGTYGVEEVFMAVFNRSGHLLQEVDVGPIMELVLTN
jgi:hypothetical protein